MKRSDVKRALDTLGIDTKGLVALHLDFGSDKQHAGGTAKHTYIERDATGLTRVTRSQGIEWDTDLNTES